MCETTLVIVANKNCCQQTHKCTSLRRGHVLDFKTQERQVVPFVHEAPILKKPDSNSSLKVWLSVLPPRPVSGEDTLRRTGALLVLLVSAVRPQQEELLPRS